MIRSLCLRPGLGDFPIRAANLDSGELLSAIRVDLEDRWRHGQGIAVEEYFQQIPRLRGQEEISLDLIYCEVLLREEVGEVPSLQDYLDRFPQYRPQLQVPFPLLLLEEFIREGFLMFRKAIGTLLVLTSVMVMLPSSNPLWGCAAVSRAKQRRIGCGADRTAP
jgi:hypothetical protein